MTSETFALLFLLLGLRAGASVEQPQPTPQQLVDLSRQASDLSNVGPYQLQATVVLNPGSAQEVVGQIAILRDKGLYHSELKLLNYREMRWIKDNALYIIRTQPLPVPRTVLLRQLDRLWRVNFASDDLAISTVHKEKDHNKQLDCFENKRFPVHQKFCFDPSNAMLTRMKNLEFHDVEFQDYQIFEQKYFPRRIIFHEENRTGMEVRDISIIRGTFSADVFTPTDHAVGLPTCDEPTSPRKIKDVTPDIPHAELGRMRSADVYLYGLIAANGTVQNVSVEYSPHPSFTTASVEALQKWRYTPAMCGDRPVPGEIETHISYFMR